jgi:spore germination protein GerM
VRWRTQRSACAVVAVLASLGGCGVTHDDAARPIDPIAALAEPTTTTSAPPPPVTTTVAPTTTIAPTTAPTAAPTENVALYYLAGDRLRAEYRFVPVASPDARIDLPHTLDQLAAGPRFSDGLTNAFTRTMVDDVESDRGRAEVWLGQAFLALDPPAQLAVVSQIVLTFTERPGIGRVLFRTAAEAEVAVPRPDGTAGVGEVTADDYAALRATA